MDRLEAMTILVTAADSGSLSAASRQLRIPLATVSRRVSDLEEHLNVRLLHRGGRKLVLTDIGRSYVASCRRIVEEIAEVERTAAGEYRAPQGELIVTAPAVLGRSHLLPIVVEFQRAFPDVRVRVQFTDRYVNLIEEHVDLAVRIGELPDSNTIGTRVGAVGLVACASPAYLKTRGTPKRPADLADHDCITQQAHTATSDWKFSTGRNEQTVEVRCRLAVSLAEAAVAAAVSGAGIARVLSYLIDDELKKRTLVKLLGAFESAPLPVSLIYPSQRQVPLKLRAFLDFATPRLRKRLGYRNA